jgi:hypothetical protein
MAMRIKTGLVKPDPRDFDRFFRTASLRSLFHGAPHGGAGRHQRVAALDQGRSQSRDQKRELYGRALVVIAAEQYASRLIVPTSQRSRPTGWGSHKDCARKALTKLAGPHLPASLKQLEKAIAKIHAEHDQAVSAAHAQPERPPSENDAGEDDAGEDEIAGLEG